MAAAGAARIDSGLPGMEDVSDGDAKEEDSLATHRRTARPPTLPAGKPWRVAVKVIDPRGNEGLRVVTMPAV